MSFFSKNRIIETDLKGMTLRDIFIRLNEEKFFKNQYSFFLIEEVDENHLIFGVPRNKITSEQIHEIKYSENNKRISIRSKYKNWFFPGFLMYGLPILALLLDWKNLTLENLAVFILIILGITFFISIIAFPSLVEDSKNIERELAIRANYLLRQKGLNIKL